MNTTLLLRSGSAAALLLLTSCFSTPAAISDVEPAKTTYWERNDVPDLEERKIRKVAIAEFSIEFVTSKYVRPFGQPRIDPSGYSLGGIAFNGLGILRRSIEYGDEVKQQLPGALYERMVQYFSKRHPKLKFVSPMELAQNPKFQKYETEETDGRSAFVQYFNPVGSDTGRVRSSDVVPVAGSKLIAGAKDVDVEDVDASFVMDSDIDLVVRARFRIGVHEGRASLERGSVVTFTGKGILGNLASNRSILSDGEVMKDSNWRPFLGRKIEINDASYRKEIAKTFEKYLELMMLDHKPAKAES